ncbi:MAG: hypothetical protein ACIAQZ_00735 [Sedimentisphaeraceae bacterium JB056]
MDFLFDMVHHNPGEQEFVSSFCDSRNLSDYGYNSQVFKHINCVTAFDELGLDLWPAGSKQRLWLDDFTAKRRAEIRHAKASGLDVYYHIDLFVLPKLLVEKCSSRICDRQGRVSLDKELTLEIHRVMFDEIVSRFPEIDGFIIRVGETYLYDTPYHCGNGAVKYDSLPSEEEKEQFVKLLKFLREEVCVKHDRKVFFRTWDCFPDRFHADLKYYLDVTDNIEPHDNLLFSIKHTQLDFWRYVEINPTLAKGRHNQIIEVQCQREYEGKGAYPSYVMGKVINGFPETKQKVGLKDIVQDSRVKGLYGWSRGGGWYGPYIKNEFWPKLNAYVIVSWFKDTSREELDIFNEYCQTYLGLDADNTARFRKFVELCDEAMLKGHYCSAFDKNRPLNIIPTNNWTRDDRLGGINQLGPVLRYLFENNLLEEALDEKRRSVELWEQALKELDSISFTDSETYNYVYASAEYGLKLFRFIEEAWRFIIYKEEGRCIELWRDYLSLSENRYSSSLYKGCYWHMPHEPYAEGILDMIDNHLVNIATS